MFRASLLSTSVELSDLQRAVQMQPSNAEYHHLLGRYFLLVRHDVPSSFVSLTKAVTLNPHVARHWLSLALAYEISGDYGQQARALEGAIAAEPTTPSVAWEAGNFYLIRGDMEKALPQLRVAMERDPSRVPQSLELAWRASEDVDKMLAHALPARVDIYLSFLNLLIDKQQTAASNKVWARIREMRQPIPADQGLPYVQYLIRAREEESAWVVWRELLALDGQAKSGTVSNNLVVNGGFEDRILNGGFDWTYRLSPSVKLTIDTNGMHSGVRSLSVEFRGDPVADIGIFQYVRVEPNTEYDFSAYLRSEDIFSARGPALLVQDAYDKTTYFESSDSLGSAVWHQHRGVFLTGESSHLLMIRIVRNPGVSRIRGRFWIDDVQLQRR